MANVKFIKITKKENPTYPSTYTAGAIYFDENKKQIMLGAGTATPTVYVGKVADATLADKKLTIKFSDGTADVVVDLSDVASATAMATELVKKLETISGDAADGKHAISASKTGIAAKVTLDIASGDDAGNVELTKTATGLSASVNIPTVTVPVTGVENGTDTEAKIVNKKVHVDVALGKAITIAGGPLANNVQETGDTWPWTDDAGNKIIPEGKSLAEILEGLFLKKQNGTLSASYTWSPSIAAPTASLGSSATVEVGKDLTATFAAGTAVSGNSSKVTISGTYGVFVDNKFQSGAYTETKAGTTTGTAAATATIKLGSATAVAATSGTAYAAAEGDNVLSVSNAGVTAVPTAFTAKTVYAATNTKEKVEGTSKAVETTHFSNKALTSTKSATVKAYYPIYTNGASSSTSDTSTPTVTATADTTKLPLVANNTTFGVAFAAQVAGGTGYRILLHSSKSIKSAKALNGLTAKYDIDVLSKFVKNTTAITKATGDTTATYYAWEYKGTEGANRVNFTIG